MSSHGPDLTPEDEKRLLREYEDGSSEIELFAAKTYEAIDDLEASFERFKLKFKDMPEQPKRLFTNLFILANYGEPKVADNFADGDNTFTEMLSPPAEGEKTFEDVTSAIEKAFSYYRENIRLAPGGRDRRRPPKLGLQRVLGRLKEIWVEGTGEPAAVSETGPFVGWANETLERLFPEHKDKAFSQLTSMAAKEREDTRKKEKMRDSKSDKNE